MQHITSSFLSQVLCTLRGVLYRIHAQVVYYGPSTGSSCNGFGRR